MSKKILLIESDAAFARELVDSLEASGFDVRPTADGKEGLDLAREYAPDGIVLCVELPKMSGYVICQKLKKDEALKPIPLVLTSSEATPETFEKHRQLKVRAEEYLIKPFRASALVEALGRVGLEAGAATSGGGIEEEVVSLEEEMGLEAPAAAPEADLPALDLGALPDEPTAEGGAPSGEDEDLKLLDDAFEGLAAPGRPPAVAPARSAEPAPVELEIEGEQEVRGDDVDAAADSLPDLDEAPARADIARIEEEADRALGALAADSDVEADLEQNPFEVAPAPAPAPRTPLRAASADLLRAAGIPVTSEPARPAAPAADDGDRARLEAEVRELQQRLEGLTRRAEAAEASATERDGELRSLRTRADGLAAQAKKADADVKAARDEARRVTDRIKTAEDRARAADDRAREADARLRTSEEDAAEARRRAEAAEDEARQKTAELAAAAEAAGKVEALERELDELKTELVVARGEAEGARGEVDKRTAELRKKLQDLESATAKNEERVLKAYQKIKADEKVKDKVRKALAIAQQLLEEGMPAGEPAADKPRAAVASAAAQLLGRE
ncbi:MAG TPA: response regulator [Anaeromyxobacteraceae bacterium]|nr:response regulator [Anaeromyxobacteraceae bacterium]